MSFSFKCLINYPNLFSIIKQWTFQCGIVPWSLPLSTYSFIQHTHNTFAENTSIVLSMFYKILKVTNTLLLFYWLLSYLIKVIFWIIMNNGLKGVEDELEAAWLSLSLIPFAIWIPIISWLIWILSKKVCSFLVTSN